MQAKSTPPHFSLYSWFVIPTLAVVTVTASCVSTFPTGPDISNWVEYHFKLSDLELAFHVPARPSERVPRFPAIKVLELDRDIDPKTRPFRMIFSELWNFDGWFWQGVYGSLGVMVVVHSRPDAYQKDLRVFENFREFMKLQVEQFQIPRNEELRRKRQDRFIVPLPDLYARVFIQGTDWLVYSFRDLFETTIYATPLTPTRYLIVSFSFSDNSRERNIESAWRQEAQRVTDQIIVSLKLKGSQGL